MNTSRAEFETLLNDGKYDEAIQILQKRQAVIDQYQPSSRNSEVHGAFTPNQTETVEVVVPFVSFFFIHHTNIPQTKPQSQREEGLFNVSIQTCVLNLTSIIQLPFSSSL